MGQSVTGRRHGWVQDCAHIFHLYWENSKHIVCLLETPIENLDLVFTSGSNFSNQTGHCYQDFNNLPCWRNFPAFPRDSTLCMKNSPCPLGLCVHCHPVHLSQAVLGHSACLVTHAWCSEHGASQWLSEWRSLSSGAGFICLWSPLSSMRVLLLAGLDTELWGAGLHCWIEQTLWLDSADVSQKIWWFVANLLVQK